MDRKAFIESHPLELSMPEEESIELRNILLKANESHVLIWEESEGIVVNGNQYYDFKIWSGTTSFASGYFHLGLLYAQHVLPIWNKRFAKNK